MDPVSKKIAVIILAAGKGTRMRSSRAKVLHTIAGRPMITYVVETAGKIAGGNIIVVIGTQAEAVRRTVSGAAEVSFAYQEEQLGTGHAVQCALPLLPDKAESVVILCGDVPLITEQTLDSLVSAHFSGKNTITILGVNMEDPCGYGRVVTDSSGEVERIVEEADATEAEKRIRTVNSGVYCVRRDFLEHAASGLKSDNSQNEIYLTDIIEAASRSGENVGMIIAGRCNELLGVNTLEDLRRVEALVKSN